LSERSVDRQRHRFSGALQSALTREEVARTYLTTVSEVIAADGLGLYELDPNAGAVVDVQANVSGLLLEEYEDYGRQDDPVLRFVTEHQRPIDSSRVAAPDDWRECGARCALGIGGFGHSMEAPVMVTGVLFGTINFARPAEAPAFSGTDLVSARIVSEQLGLATERALRFEMTGHRSSALEQALDRIPQAVIVTDLDARPIFQNRAARNELHISSGPDAAVRPTDTVGGVINEAMSEFRAEGKRVFTRSLRDSASDRQSIVKSYRLSDKDQTAVTLIFNCAQDNRARTLPVWDVLTRREQEIAQLVSEGLTTKQIAAQAFISENTVKQHLKRVFAKTDVSNRAELVQLIWTSGQRPG
jgi:DNA-binding CsgD family transcriptional regulator/GAF domain-containing protein